MTTTREPALAVLVATALMLPVVGLGFHSGANSGLTNGPFNNASNCSVCHEFEYGSGRVELLDAARRYLPGRTYDLRVRVFDVDQVGAGFEISAETGSGHVGTLVVSDALSTQFADGDPSYITHTSDGYDASLDGWVSAGSSHTYEVQWIAPDVDAGLVTLFAVGNAANDQAGPAGEHFYATYSVSHFARIGDADGDSDIDLRDVAVLQNCMDSAADLPSTCAYLDEDGDAVVDLSDFAAWLGALDGPIAPDPPGFVLADPVRGARLYDKWWPESILPEPTTDHPLWATRPDSVSNTRTGSTTWRCKECHGWDYKGVDGVYGAGSHRTGIAGVFGTDLSPTEIFALLRDPTDHAYTESGTGLSDTDLWDLVRFVTDGVVDTDDHIDGSGAFLGASNFGSVWYGRACIGCHGEDGTQLDFGTSVDPVYVGTLGVANPWELLHKTRFGHPGAPMIGTDVLRWDVSRASDIGAYAQTLPVE